MAVINPPGYLNNLSTHTAQVDRLASLGLLLPSAATELRARGGLRMVGDYAVTAQATPNMTVNVGSGIAYVPGPTAIAGTYNVANDGAVVLSVSAAHATLARQDLVVLRVYDSFYSGATNLAEMFVLTGTAGSGTDPTPGAGYSYIILARITVPAAATAITNAMITMLARPIQVSGGILPVLASDVTAGMYVGQYRDHPTSGIQRWDGSAWNDIKDADSGWQNITFTNGATYSTETPQCRKIGKAVWWRGTFSNTGLTANTLTQVATIPVGYRPAVPERFVPGMAGATSQGRVIMTSAGSISIEPGSTVSGLFTLTGIRYLVD